MIRYSTNWMGPVSWEWAQKHGEHWSVGRIDILGTVPDWPVQYTEYGLGIMHSEDWNALTKWLDTVKTDDVWTREHLLDQFEKFYGKKIRYWYDQAHFTNTDNPIDFPKRPVMNDKIEHCLYESGLTAQGCWDELDDYAKQSILRFAELIVRECITVVNECNLVDDDPIANIKEHFGVE